MSNSGHQNVDLALIASETVAKLDVIWKETGKDNDSRRRAVQKVHDDVAAIYASLLRVEEEGRDTAKRLIAEYNTDIRSIAALLGITVDNVSVNVEMSWSAFRFVCFFR